MRTDFKLVIAEAFDPGTVLGALCYALLFASVALILTRVVHFTVRRGSRYLSDPIAGDFLAQFLQVLVVLGMLILYAHLVPALRSLGTALLTGRQRRRNRLGSRRADYPGKPRRRPVAPSLSALQPWRRDRNQHAQRDDARHHYAAQSGLYDAAGGVEGTNCRSQQRHGVGGDDPHEPTRSSARRRAPTWIVIQAACREG